MWSVSACELSISGAPRESSSLFPMMNFVRPLKSTKTYLSLCERPIDSLSTLIFLVPNRLVMVSMVTLAGLPQSTIF